MFTQIISRLLCRVFGLKSSKCFQLLTDLEFNTPILWMWECCLYEIRRTSVLL